MNFFIAPFDEIQRGHAKYFKTRDTPMPVQPDDSGTQEIEREKRLPTAKMS